MATSNTGVEKKLIAEKNNKVKIPLLFSITRDRKTSILLATYHALPLFVLVDECRQVIQSCASFVTEQISDENDIIQYYTKAVLRDKSSKSWMDELPPEVAEFLEKMVEIFFEAFADESLKNKIADLTIWAVYEQALQGVMRSIVKNQASDSNNEQLSMDDDLMLNVFKGKIAGLENLMDSIPISEREASSIQDLLTLYQDATGVLSSERNDNNDMLRERMLKYCDADAILSPTAASEANSDQDTIFRNINWVPNIIKHHNTLESPVLFGVGVAHLSGEQGLLSLLPAAGFKIQHLKPNGYFEDYTYPFTSYFASKLSLTRERRMFSWTTEVSDYKRAITHQYTKLSSSDTQIVRDYLGEEESPTMQPCRNLSFFQRLQKAIGGR